MDRPRVVITGVTGAIGGVLARYLAERYEVVGLDVRPAPTTLPVVDFHLGSVTDRDLIAEAFRGARAVVHLATGSPGGWSALLEVDVRGTREVFRTAADLSVGRVIYASSNHAVGGFEADQLRGALPPGGASLDPTEPVRPDSEYGVSKAFGEAYGRFIAETTGTAVSCLRIGTVRAVDDPEAFLDAPELAYIPGGRQGVRARLRRTWLSHADLVRIVDEELASTDRYRVRFAASSSELWSASVYVWNPR